MFRDRTYLALILVLFTVVFGSCTRGLDFSKNPQDRLKDYISKSFSVKHPSDRNGLMAYLTGDVKARLEGWSEDQFKEAFIDSNREFGRLSFKEVKVISPKEVQITYELSFVDQGRRYDNRKHQAKVTNKKLCQMVLEKDAWMIADVRNIKELVEYQNELSLP